MPSLVVLQLGMLLGTRLWYGFHDCQADQALDAKVDEMCREMGPPPRAAEAVAAAAPPPPSGSAMPSAAAPAPAAAAPTSGVPPAPVATAPAANVQSLVELTALLSEARREALRERDELETRLAAQVVARLHAISGRQLAGLQARLEALRDAELLTDEELHVLEDICGDFVELGPVTLEMVPSSDAACKCLRLTRLSEGIAADRAFARQARRKFINLA